MIRAILQAITDLANNVKRFTASGRPDETITDREIFQQYGFTSSPQPGAEGIVIKEGNHFIMIATDDRRYRIPLVSGEVCIYTDEGDNIHFQRGKNLVITTGNQLTINATSSVTINAPSVLVGGATGGKALLTSDFIALYNAHTHGESPVPSVPGSALQETQSLKGI